MKYSDDDENIDENMNIEDFEMIIKYFWYDMIMRRPVAMLLREILEDLAAAQS